MQTIHTSLAPTVTGWDVRRAVALLLQPSAWQNGPERLSLEQELSALLGGASIVAVDSGRNALRLALQLFGIGASDEVLLQAYTCVSVPGPALWVGAHPVYVDIRPDTFTMDPEDFERKITARSRAVIIQHTFGLPTDIEPILAIARRHNLVAIEDCAHALGATYQGRPVGTFGDAAIFSFGRDKAISSVFGGAVTWKSDIGSRVSERFRSLTSDLRSPPSWWITQQLLHPLLVASLIRPTYAWGGRYLLRGLQELHVLSKALVSREKRGGEPRWGPRLLPNALAALARRQLTQLPAFLEHRQALARHYTESLRDAPGLTLPTVPPDRTHAFLRYTIRVADTRRLHAAARRAGIILGDWYDTVVAPRGTDLRSVSYEPGSCPQAEEAARCSVSLPTSPTLGVPDADRVAGLVSRTVR